MSDIEFPDLEIDLRDWLRTLDIAGIGSRVYLRPNQVNEPCLTVWRVTGSDDPSTAPLDVVLIQIDVWGPERSRPAARAITNRLRTHLRSMPATVGSTHVHAPPEVLDDRYLPDPADERPRYAVTARFVTSLHPT